MSCLHFTDDEQTSVNSMRSAQSLTAHMWRSLLLHPQRFRVSSCPLFGRVSGLHPSGVHKLFWSKPLKTFQTVIALNDERRTGLVLSIAVALFYPCEQRR